jgi:ribosome maturation factor RimP
LYTLAQMSQYINGTVKLQLNTLIENRKRFECQIISIEDELITVHVIERILKSKKKTTVADPIVLQIPFDYIDKANVVTQFDIK